MMLQRLATGATGVNKRDTGEGLLRGSEALVRACAVYTQRCIAFRRGFCTLVLSSDMYQCYGAAASHSFSMHCCAGHTHFRLRLWGQVDSGVETRRFGDPPLLDTLSSDLLSVQDSSSQLKALGEESCSNSNTPKIQYTPISPLWRKRLRKRPCEEIKSACA